jgi:hypothetical protein
MKRKIEYEPVNKNNNDILHFKKPLPYPLKEFFHRNGITGVQITQALGLSTKGHLSNELLGLLPMPEWIDRKLRATALHMNSHGRASWPLYSHEKDYCEKGMI